MKRKLKTWALRVLLALPLLCLLALLAGNVWLNTASAKSRIIARVAGYAPGEEASIGTVTFFPWSGLKVREMRLGERFYAEAVVAEVDLRSALTKRIEIDELRFVKPVFSLTPSFPSPVVQTSSMMEPLPQAPPEITQVVPHREPTPLRSRSIAPDEVPKPPVPPVVSSRRVVMIMRAAMEEGELIILNPEGGEAVKLSGLSMDVDLSTASAMAGVLRMKEIEFRGRGLASNGVAHLQVAGDMVQLSKMSADCQGGKISGMLAFRPRLPGAPIQVEVKATGVQLESLWHQIGGSLDEVELVSGSADAELRMQGYLRALPQSVAEVKLTVNDGRVKLANRTVGRGVESAPDGSIQLEPVTLGAVFAGGQITLREATLRSGNTVVKSLGYVSTKGDLNLSTRLYVGEGMHQSLSNRVASLKFADLDRSGLFYRDFLVRGNVRSPVSDFWQTGELLPMKQVIGNLQNLAQAKDVSPVPTVGVGTRP